MPGVNWNREFGDGNISVSLGRRLRNDFSINTGMSFFVQMEHYANVLYVLIFLIKGL